MTTIVKIGFSFAVKLVNLAIIEISGWQRSLTQQLYELLWQLHHQYMLTILMFRTADVIWWDFCLQCTQTNSFSSSWYLHLAWLYLLTYFWLNRLNMWINVKVGCSVIVLVWSWMKTLCGKDRQGECTITHHIGGATRSTEKELIGRKKSSKKYQGQPILTIMIAKQKHSKFIYLYVYLFVQSSVCHLLISVCWNFEGLHIIAEQMLVVKTWMYLNGVFIWHLNWRLKSEQKILLQ